MYENRKWVIITLADYSDEQLENLCANAIQNGVGALRKTIDNSKAILKWDGAKPRPFYGITTYNHSEILEILKGEDWTQPIEN